MTVSIALIWYFGAIHLIFLVSIPTNVAHLELNASVQEMKVRCIEKERVALLSFKQTLVDEFDVLSSWDTDVNSDCCNWKGVECNNTNTTTHQHIIGLHLHGSYLMGEVSSSLTQLSHLNYLDLSHNQFDGIVLEDIVSLIDLKYLDLSYNNFATLIPPRLGNLSKLSILDLSSNSWLNHNFTWLISSAFSSLKYLDLSFVNFRGGIDWTIAINNLPLLQSLFLSNCHLPTPILSPHYPNTNFSRFLVKLDLSWNDIDFTPSKYYYSSMINSTKLVHLNLGYNNLQDLNFHDFENMNSLVFLDLTFTHINFPTLKSFKNLCNLKSLGLSFNNIGGLLSDFLKAFPPRVLDSFQYLNLASNNFSGFLPNFTLFPSLEKLGLSNNMLSGSLPNFTILPCLKVLDLSHNMLSGFLPNFTMLPDLENLYLHHNMLTGFLPNFTMLPSLKALNLFHNMLNGTIDQNLGQLSKLVSLDLGQNLLEGEVSETHFAKLTHLKYLDLSDNSLNLNIKSNWVPPFQLDYISLGYCKMGPQFPRWLQTQNFSFIDISFAEISDIIPRRFWYTLSPNLYHLDLSGNKMVGEIEIPDLSMNNFKQIQFINFESNKFMGRIPSFLFQSSSLHLSNNSFSDLSGLCELVDSPLHVLDLSNNQLLGQLPDCWYSMKRLFLLDLSNNYLSGDIPHSMSNLTLLLNLLLRNNQFSGGLHNLFNLTFMMDTFDAMNNNFSGTIPSWIGWKSSNLIHLNLKSNNFHGDLPSTLCNLSKIQVLDISSNYISGSIPTCINNFNVLTQTTRPQNLDSFIDDAILMPEGYRKQLAMMWKRKERLITGEVLKLEKSIDLSCNHLSGNIPTEITELIGLATLNLSNNELTGPIPSNMGQLQSLESLDLSINRFYGPIPATLSQISRLSALNLSYNNLSGKIPTSTQLQSFLNSSYEGNPYLCGEPLKKCFDEIPPEPNNDHVDNENENEDSCWFVLREFLMSMAFGYIVGFWGIFGSLILHRRWRHAYFKFFRNTIY